MTVEATERANTYLCLATSLSSCEDTLDPSRWMARARYDYAFWWAAHDAPRILPTSINHVAFSGERCGLAYLSDHRAVQVELRAP